MMKNSHGALIAALLTSCVAAAEVPPAYDRVELSASAEGQVDNDILVAFLSRQMEGAGAAVIAEQVSRSVGQATKSIKQLSDIKVQTLDYQTSPIYREERIIGWRVRQSLRLESGNFVQLSGLLGDLQQTLTLDSIDYDVSPQKLKQAEEGLIEQALLSFQQRADKVTHVLGRTRYRVISLHIGGPGDFGRPPLLMNARPPGAEAMAPSIEPGERKVRVTVTGTIELQTD